MKKIIFLFVLLINVTLNAQSVKLPANTRADLQLIAEDLKTNNGKASDRIKDRFAVYSINGVDCISMMAKTTVDFDANTLNALGIISGREINRIVSLKVPVALINSIDQLPGIEIIQLAGKIKPDLDKVRHDVGADSVHLGINLPQSYTGKDVLIGITDWGFDYSSPMFYDTLLQESRILAAWDQYKTSGPNPSGFNYGTEFTNIADMINVGSDTSNIYSYHTHGTHVAGIAGGSGAGTIYRGMAFESQFLFTSFLVDEASVLDAWEWMYQKSVAESKRLVINMSWGLYHMGTLDGNSLLSQAISGYAALGVVFSNSGGNNGNVNFHIKKTFSNNSFTSKIDFYSYSANPNMWGQSIHAWGEVGKEFKAGLKVYNAGGTSFIESPLYSTDLVSSYIDSFLVMGIDTVWFNLSMDQSHPMNGRPQMRLRVKNTNTTLKVLLRSEAVDGTVHYWNVTELSNDVGNWGMPFSIYGVGSIAGDNQYGISEPSCADDLISVAAYTAQYLTGGGSPAGGSIASFSSIGPRYDEVLKPDISAPGSSVASSISSYTDAAYTMVAFVDFEGRTYPFAKFSGTSMSSPCVAGICALILEANPYLSAAQVKEIIKITAREDSYTGDISDQGSTRWGWGKIDAYQAVILALEMTGTEEMDIVPEWTIYPNPSQDELNFSLHENLPSVVQIIDVNGKQCERKIENGKVNISALNAGKYWLRMEVNGRIGHVSFIKN